MAKRLSISSSDTRPLPGGVPWALVGAVVILAIFEVFVRRMPASKKIPYSGGIEEHFAVANYLQERGRADVGFMGSSLTRAGVSAPAVRKTIQEKLGKKLYIANYGASSATADEAAAIVSYMIRKRAVPRVLMYEVSPQHFRTSTSYQLRKLAIFWGIGDLATSPKSTWASLPRLMPIVVRNEIGDFYQTFRYRERWSQWAKERLGLWDPQPAPMAGAAAKNWQSRAAFSAASPVRKKWLFERWARNWLRGGQFVLDQSLITDFEAVLRTCREHDIKLVLYEMPFSELARTSLPPETYPEFYRIVDTLSRKYNVPFVKVADLGIHLDDDNFADPAHMNRYGAATISQALAEKAILPVLLQNPRFTAKPQADRRQTSAVRP